MVAGTMVATLVEAVICQVAAVLAVAPTAPWSILMVAATTMDSVEQMGE